MFKNWFKKKDISDLAQEKGLRAVSGNHHWNRILVDEPYSGAWQKNDELTQNQKACFPTVFSCISLISKDIGKMGLTLKRWKDGVLQSTGHPFDLRYILKKPNHFQTWQQFQEYWTNCLLLRGNAYIFIVRDVFGVPARLVCLNPDLVQPLVSESGEIFYSVYNDLLAQTEPENIPASEIIHDRINCLYHPLVGLSPIFACGVAAGVGHHILHATSKLFSNGARPASLLVAPGPLENSKAKEMQKRWNEKFTGNGIGGTAVLSDGVQYTQLGISAIDAQTIEQLKYSSFMIATAFNVPPFKLGLEPPPSDVQSANEIYFSDCIQAYVESRENLIDEALELKTKYSCELYLDIDALIRMDRTSKMNFFSTGTQRGIFSPNEARAAFGYGPVSGGESPMIQQQNYSLEAIRKRDAKDDPFEKSTSGVSKDE